MKNRERLNRVLLLLELEANGHADERAYAKDIRRVRRAIAARPAGSSYQTPTRALGRAQAGLRTGRATGNTLSVVTRHPVRAGAWFVMTALVVYGALIAIVTLVAMANGDGLSCRDAECGAVSNWFSDAYPFPMIASIAVSVIAGAVMARRRTRT